MELDVTFGQIIDDVRAELGQSLSQGASTSQLPKVKRAINATLISLYAANDWPHLRTTFDRISMAAGQRYYDPPPGLDIERIEDAVVYWNESPHPIYRGIGAPEMSSYDSVKDERSDPPLRYAIRLVDAPTTKTMIEIWPVPASGQATIEFYGTRKVGRLVQDADICPLDAESVTLYAAAAISDPEDVERLLARAKSHFDRAKGRKPAAPKTRIGLGHKRNDELLSGRAVVRVAGGS